jgi:two-component system chemotaxis response regulator CheB
MARKRVASVTRERPDIVTMDIQMPRLDGYDATRAIMENCPVPIIVVSNTIDHNEVATSFRALEAGAVMALGKPAGPGHPEYEMRAHELVTAIRLMSEVKVVRRLAKYRMGQADVTPVRVPLRPRDIRAVGIGASTGGPLVLQQILRALPGDFPVPIFIVQHMADGFISGLAEWLDQSCALTVQLAQRPRHGTTWAGLYCAGWTTTRRVFQWAHLAGARARRRGVLSLGHAPLSHTGAVFWRAGSGRVADRHGRRRCGGG